MRFAKLFFFMFISKSLLFAAPESASENEIERALSNNCIPVLSSLTNCDLLGKCQIRSGSFRVVQRPNVDQDADLLKVSREISAQLRFFFLIGKPYRIDQRFLVKAKTDGTRHIELQQAPMAQPDIQYFFFGKVSTMATPATKRELADHPNIFSRSPHTWKKEFMSFLRWTYGPHFVSLAPHGSNSFLLRLKPSFLKSPHFRELTVENNSWYLFDPEIQDWRKVIFDIEGLLIGPLRAD